MVTADTDPMPASVAVGTVAGLWRYPVKSLQGERLRSANITARGLDGDRRRALVVAGKPLSAKRDARLMAASAVLLDGHVLVRLPDGEELDADDPATPGRLSMWLGYDVTVRRSGHDEAFVDDVPVHVVSAASLRAAGLGGQAVDVRRFRPTFLVDTDATGWAEDAWLGAELTAGPVRLRITKEMIRCVMVGHPQPGLADDPTCLPRLRREHAASLGVCAEVVTPGRVSVGDPVTLCAPPGAGPG